MEGLNQKRNGLLSFIAVILILSGSIFDISDQIIKTSFETWTKSHLILKDIQSIGFALLAFSVCSYKIIKIKVLTFMLILWRTMVLLLNLYCDSPLPYTVVPLYAIYIIWIYRSMSVGRKGSTISLDNVSFDLAYNIMFPISSFRGLLQALFTFNNPNYETRMLLHNNNIFLVLNNTFTRKPYDKEALSELIKRNNGEIKNKGAVNIEKIYDAYDLVGKRSIFAVRDCRRLEV